MQKHADLERQERKARRADEEHAPDRNDPRLQSIVALQRSLGNASVARMLNRMRSKPETAPVSPRTDTHEEKQSFQFNAAIRIGPQARRPSSRVALGIDSDSPKGELPHEELHAIEAAAGEPLAATTMAAAAAAPGTVPSTPEGLAEQEPASPDAAVGPPDAAASPDAATKEAAGDTAATQEVTLSLPDIEVRDFEAVDLCDAVTPWLSYAGTIAQGGATPNGYGVTRPGPMNVTGITVRKLPVIGWWYVSATITQQILWQVRAVTGPRGEVNISSALDPAITAANWQQVVDDLTPDMSDLNGRPPRSQFWAKDLTEQHEAFHANDRKTRAPGALSLASNWLGMQQAATDQDVRDLLAQVPGRMVSTVAAGMTMPGKEERAYGDGAGAYSRRATAIWALGKIGYYR